MQTLQASAVLDEENEFLNVYVSNADLAEGQELSLDVRGFEGWELAEHLVMDADSEDAANTWERPDRIVPRAETETRMEKGVATALLRKESWNVLRFRKAAK